MTATPSPMVAIAGQAAPPVSFAIRKILYFNSAVAITLTPPAGISCNLSPCSVVTADKAPNALTLTAASTLAPGSYAIPMQASSTGLPVQSSSLTMNVIAANVPVTTPAPVTTTPDFSLTVSPAVTTVVAGSATAAFSFAVTRTGGQTAPVVVTAGLPTGFTCSASPCGTTITAAPSANAFTVTPAASVAAGAYTLTFSGSDGVNTHTATATVMVTAAPVTPVLPPTTPVIVPSGCRTSAYQGMSPSAPAGMRFTYTGNAEVSGWSGLNHLVYDAAHNVVFESNVSLNEVDVLSPNDMTLIYRIPVPAPVGMDLSPDGKTLYVGSLTPFLYRIDTSLFCLFGRDPITVYPNSLDTVGSDYLIPIDVAALSDGSVAILLITNGSGIGDLAIWTPQGTHVVSSYYDLGSIHRSGDRKHLYLAGADSGGWFGRYDTATGTVVGRTVSFGSFPNVLAVNLDGSKLLSLLDCCGLTLLDGDFNAISSSASPQVQQFDSGALATPDFSRIYLRSILSSKLDVLDGSTLKLLGSIPGPTDYAHDRSLPAAFDGTGRMLFTAEMGVASMPVGDPVQGLPNTGIRQGYPSANSGLTPASPVNGYATALNGAGFTAPSAVLFGGVPATNVQFVNSNVINLTAPSLNTDCVDVAALFTNGSAAMQPLAYCYRPRVLYLSGDAGPVQGGGKLTLYGMGLGDSYATSTRVLIGGTEAQAGAVNWVGISPYALQLTTLTVTVPAGRLGPADIQVITPSGSTTLASAYTYVDRAETSLNSSASPVEMILDSKRQRLLISDSSNNQILVYSTAGKTMLTPVPVGSSPRGLALTPDGTRLMVVTAGDSKVSVLDADSYNVIQQANIPASASRSFPQWVLPLQGNAAMILVQPGYLDGVPYLYDLQANTLTAQPGMSTNQNELQGAATPDGRWAVIGSYLYDAVTRTSQKISQYPAGLTAFAPDGSRFFGTASSRDRTGRLLNNLHSYDLVSDLFSKLYAIGAGQVSGGSSLLYQPTNLGIRIWDVQHASIRKDVSLPGSEGLNYADTTKLLAVDPGGERAWTINAHGLVDIQFAADPLSIGSAQISSGTLTVMGSGFTSTMQVSIDGQSVSANVSGTTQFTATPPALATGGHAIQITDSGGRAYTLDLAFSTP